jgi:hypothetical protein
VPPYDAANAYQQREKEDPASLYTIYDNQSPPLYSQVVSSDKINSKSSDIREQ